MTRARKWTPGPWAVNTLAGPTEISTVDPFEDIGCAYSDGPDDKTAIANAALIAAAPELFSALENLVNSLADQDEEGLIEHAEQMRAARAALSRAGKE